MEIFKNSHGSMEITERSLKTNKPDCYHYYSIYVSIGVQTGGVDIPACCKGQVLKSRCKHTQIALKSKTFAIPTSNEITIILKVVIFKLAYSVTTIDALNLVKSKNSLKEKS